MKRLMLGLLKQRLIIQQPVTTADAIGGTTKSWQTLATVWGRATPVRGTQFFAGFQKNSEEIYEFMVRYRSGITPQHRILWRNKIYRIISVLHPEGEQEWLVITAKFNNVY